VTLNYDAPADNASILKDTIGGAVQATNNETFGGTFAVRINKDEFKGQVVEKGTGITVELGEISLQPGPVVIEVQADSITGKELMRLKSLTLTPQAAQ
jgi:hypothetical protein